MPNYHDPSAPDYDPIVAMCVDCGYVKPDSRAMRDPFLQQGAHTSCGICGGVVLVCDYTDKDDLMARRARGEAF